MQPVIFLQYGERCGYSYQDAALPPIDVLVVLCAEHSMDTALQDSAMIGWVCCVGCGLVLDWNRDTIKHITVE